VLNAANEAAVDLFLKEGIRFVQIPKVIESALTRFSGGAARKGKGALYPSLDQLVGVHQAVLRYVQELYGAQAN
jgi:1-deoxy-D-xylulose 5-phosphate reductoisomerase